MESQNKTVGLVVALVIGLIVGGGVGWAVSGMNNMSDDMNNNANMSQEGDMGGDGVTVGGAKMVREKDIVDNAANASNVSTLVDLVGKAGLVETLKGEGPFTVFGPNNGAFEKLPAETVADLQKEENKDMLANILTYHVVPGTYTSADLKVMAQNGESLKTVQGEMLMPVMKDNMLHIEDAKGGESMIETADVISSNGVTHVVDSVLMPKN